MKTVGQPRQKTFFGRRKIDTCHPYLGKSEFKGPGLYVSHQLRTVDLSTVERHPPIVETSVRAMVWRNEDDTRAFAARLAVQLNEGIELHGDLGAGKTTLVRHLLRALGVTGLIKSPTYAVVEPYELPGLAISHFDFYRFNDPHEWEDAGFRDIFAAPGLKLAEWPEKAASQLPPADLVVRIEAQPDETRQVTLKAQSAIGQELLP